MIVAPDKLDFTDKNIIMILSGLPGVGKTTLALSAPDTILIDTDRGMARVNPAHRKASSQINTYQELLDDLEQLKKTKQYKTVIVDTTGELIELMKAWAVETDPNARKKNGGISLQGYGVVKSEYLRLSADLRRLFNVIFVFHVTREKSNDDITYELVCEGAPRTMVWQPADLGAYMQIINGDRYLGFSPTDQYSAKAAYGIKGLIKLPELAEDDNNDFLTQLFAKVRANLSAESKTYNADKTKYDQAMKLGQHIINSVTGPDDLTRATSELGDVPHALTSEAELKKALMNHMTDLGWSWDKKAKTWVRDADDGPGQ